MTDSDAAAAAAQEGQVGGHQHLQRRYGLKLEFTSDHFIFTCMSSSCAISVDPLQLAYVIQANT